MANITFILALLGIGKLLSRIPAFPGTTFQVLASVVIYVSLPALILVQVPQLPISAELMAPIIMPWAMLLISAAIVWCVSRRFKWNRQTTGALLLVVPLGNTSFLGIPMVQAYFGKDLVPYAILYDQLGTFLALATYGSLVVATYAASDRPPLSSIIKRVIAFPPFLAIILAFLLRRWSYPQQVAVMLENLAATLVPLVMIAVGFRLTFRLPADTLRPLGFGLLVKLVAAPLIALIACRAAGIESDAVRVAIFETGMPPQISAGAVAIAAGLAPDLVAAMVGLGILLSIATLPAIYYLM